MFTDMEKWAEIRRRVLVDGLSKRAACRQYEIHWDTLAKILNHTELPPFRRAAPRPMPENTTPLARARIAATCRGSTTGAGSTISTAPLTPAAVRHR